jgi:putative tricarboxylic transport membrane protein
MSTEQHTPPPVEGTTAATLDAPPPDPAPGPTNHADGWRAFWHGRGTLVIAALILALAVYLTIGLLTMDVPDSAQPPGPKFYPTILAIGAYLLAVLLAVDTLRRPEPDAPVIDPHVDEETARATAAAAAAPVDPKAVGIAVAAFLAFSLVLEPLGWILSAALLFWVMSWALGAKRPLLGLGIGLVLSSAVQVAFSMGLGLTLPSGLLGGIF